MTALLALAPQILAAALAAAPAEDNTYYRPQGQCLEAITTAVSALGTRTPEENRIDFEETLEVRGSEFTILYYKNIGDSGNFLGKAVVDLEILSIKPYLHSFVDVMECNVRSARIIEEGEKTYE